MDPAGSGNDLIFPAQVALYGEPRDPREGSGPSPDPRPTSSLRPGPNANGPGHAFASPPSRRAIRGFPTGIRLLPPRYIPEKTFPARGTSAQSFTPPPKLPTFPKRRSPSGVPGSVATGDLSHAREASSLHGMRKRPPNLSHARGAIAISSLPAFLRTRAAPAIGRHGNTVPDLSAPGLSACAGRFASRSRSAPACPFAGFCRLRVPGRTAFVRHRGAPPLPHAFRTPAVSTGIPPRSRGVTPSRIVLTAVAAPDRIVIDCH